MAPSSSVPGYRASWPPPPMTLRAVSFSMTAWASSIFPSPAFSFTEIGRLACPYMSRMAAMLHQASLDWSPSSHKIFINDSSLYLDSSKSQITNLAIDNKSTVLTQELTYHLFHTPVACDILRFPFICF